MSYTLTYKHTPTYLHVIVTGQNTKENSLKYMEELRNECVARDCFRLLIEERLEGPRLKMINVFEIAVRGSALARGLAKVIAFVDVNDEGGLLRFAEDVAVNRGAPVVTFKTVAEAEQWLLKFKQ